MTYPNGTFVLPRQFGAPDDGKSPASAGLQAAIDALAGKARGGLIWIDRPYALDRGLILRPGVVLMGNGSFNRRTFPDSFLGARLYPHGSAPLGMSLLSVGASGAMGTNPNGGYIQGVALDGRKNSGGPLRGAVGLHIRDTSDFRAFNCYFGGFDRTDNTGICALVEGAAPGNCLGATFDHCIFSNSQHGVFYTGEGATDMRHSNNLYVGVTRALTLGYDDRGATLRQEGGSGCQVVNDHFTYTGMPAQGWFIRSGGQGGTLMVSNAYFDQHGSAYPIRLGNSKAKIVGCHFLMARAQHSPGLIRVQTAGSQQLVATGNTIDLRGSRLQSFVHYTAREGVPSGGIVSGNTVYGKGQAWKGIAMDRSGTVLPPTDNGSFYLGQNVRSP